MAVPHPNGAVTLRCWPWYLCKLSQGLCLLVRISACLGWRKSESLRRFTETLRQNGLFDLYDFWSQPLQLWLFSQDNQLAGRFAWSTTVLTPRLHGDIKSSEAITLPGKARSQPYEHSGSWFSCNTETSTNLTMPGATRRHPVSKRGYTCLFAAPGALLVYICGLQY